MIGGNPPPREPQRNMKITLTKVSHKEKYSEETHCFDATVCVDGKPSFLVSNRGTGGNNYYNGLDGSNYLSIESAVKDCNNWCGSLPKKVTEIKNKDGTFWKMSVTLDYVICNLVNDYLEQKKFLRTLKTKWNKEHCQVS